MDDEKEGKDQIMISMLHRHSFRTAVFIVVVGVSLATTIQAGPYLHRTTELSNASSQAQCQSFASGVMARLAKEGHFKVDSKNPRLGWTNGTTLFVDCLFVGRNEKGRNQWIYYITTASTDLAEANKLRSLVADRLSKITRFD